MDHGGADPGDARGYRAAASLSERPRNDLKLLEMNGLCLLSTRTTRWLPREIRYGDNDRLAARVATMIGADLLVLFSDIDGLYTAPPASDPKAQFIPVVERITPAIEAMAGALPELSRGGMRTKSTRQDRHRRRHAYDHRRWPREESFKARDEGGAARRFLTPNPATARKTWIAGALEPREHFAWTKAPAARSRAARACCR